MEEETPRLGVSSNLQQIADKNEFIGNFSAIQSDGYQSADFHKKN